jgi:osmotically-inducible protein OsmY
LSIIRLWRTQTEEAFMNTLPTLILVGATLVVSGCARLGQSPGAGTAGGYETGVAREEGSTPYAIGRTGPYQRGGLSSAAIAASRQEAALDVSGKGTGELARRSAAATVEPVERPMSTTRTSDDWAQNAGPDKTVLDRVRRALAAGDPDKPSLSIQTMNNLRLAVRDGVLSIEGRVASLDESRTIESLVRGVMGVTEVRNELQVQE